jgi:hypothetical protein
MIDALAAATRPARSTPSLGVTAPLAPTTELATARPPQRGRTALLGVPPVAPPRRRRRRLWFALTLVAAATGLALLALFLAGRHAPATPPANAASHHTTSARNAPATDVEGASIRQLASSLAGAGQPGDGALAAALDATAAQSPGAGRQAAADQTLALAEVLLAGGGITDAQFQDVANVLAPTGATVPTTTVPSTTLPPPAPGPSPGHGPGHGHGGEQGDQG